MEWYYDSACFACGERNPIGLKLKFELGDDQVVRTRFVPGANHQSWPGIMHGGLTATIADEIMGRCLNVLGYVGVTARLELRYHSAVPLGEAVVFEAWSVKTRLPVVDMEARAILSSGKLAMTATARFMVKGSYEDFMAVLAAENAKDTGKNQS